MIPTNLKRARRNQGSSSNQKPVEHIAHALQAVASHLYSPNECDSNWEPANIVDGLYVVARANRALAKAIQSLADATLAAREKAPAEKQ